MNPPEEESSKFNTCNNNNHLHIWYRTDKEDWFAVPRLHVCTSFPRVGMQGLSRTGAKGWGRFHKRPRANYKACQILRHGYPLCGGTPHWAKHNLIIWWKTLNTKKHRRQGGRGTTSFSSSLNWPPKLVLKFRRSKNLPDRPAGCVSERVASE